MQVRINRETRTPKGPDGASGREQQTDLGSEGGLEWDKREGADGTPTTAKTRGWLSDSHTLLKIE